MPYVINQSVKCSRLWKNKIKNTVSFEIKYSAIKCKRYKCRRVLLIKTSELLFTSYFNFHLYETMK